MHPSEMDVNSLLSDIIEGYKDFETDKLICVDIRATDELGRVFVIEVQIVAQASFAKRAVFYARQAQTEQLRAGQANIRSKNYENFSQAWNFFGRRLS